MKRVIISIGILFIIGTLCIYLSIDKDSLGEGYFYLSEYDAFDLGYPGGGIIYKSPEKYLFHDIVVSGNVIRVNHNKEFILALQFPSESATEDLKELPHYFIIQKKLNLIQGPCNKEMYLQKRKELDVPETLVLEE
jgi:hypothetical protein